MPAILTCDPAVQAYVRKEATRTGMNQTVPFNLIYGSAPSSSRTSSPAGRIGEGRRDVPLELRRRCWLPVIA